MKALCLVIIFACAACKPITRQEEPVSDNKKFIVMKNLLQRIFSPIRRQGAKVLSIAKRMSKQKNYRSLVEQLENVRFQVIDVRRDYELVAERNLKKMASNTAVTPQGILRFERELTNNYKKWSDKMSDELTQSLRANQLFKPERPELVLGNELKVMKAGSPVYITTMKQLTKYVEETIAHAKMKLRLP